MAETIDTLVGDGRLADAIQMQQSEVREHPTDVDRRYRLFVLLGFAGELERAALQLDALEMQDPQLATGLLLYRSLLRAEAERRDVYETGGSPLLPPDPPAHLQTTLQVLAAMRKGDSQKLREVLDLAARNRPMLRGRLNGEPFASLRDYDDSLAAVLEVYAGGRYLWLPWERLRKLESRAPSNLIDCLWLQAHVEDTDGKKAEVHLPVLYEGSHKHADERVRLGRLTEWLDQHGVTFRGCGQKELLVTQNGTEEDVGILAVRKLEIEASSS